MKGNNVEVKEIVGFHLAQTLHAQGAIVALKMALAEHAYPQQVIHHSDRGVQYCYHDFLDEIRTWNLQSSMTDADHCAQNALAECMNGILKKEFLLDLGFRDFAEATTVIDEAILTYNTLRIHGSLGSRTPAEVHQGTELGYLKNWLNQIISFEAPLPPRLNSSVYSI